MAYFYKWLGKDATAANGGGGVWHKPWGNRPGKWMPRIDNIIPCERGYHVCRRKDLSRWIGEELWLVEVRGEAVEAENKVVASEARLLRRIDAWDEQTQRIFACLCAYSVLDLFERDYPGDARPRAAVDVAWRFTFGEATADELAADRAAAWAAWAAWAAGAAGAAARDAVRGAQSELLINLLGLDDIEAVV